MEGRGDAEMEPWEIVDVVGSVLVVGGMGCWLIWDGMVKKGCWGGGRGCDVQCKQRSFFTDLGMLIANIRVFSVEMMD
jgi:hypothetical protein